MNKYKIKHIATVILFCIGFTTFSQGTVNLVATPQSSILNTGEKVSISIQAVAGLQEVANVQLVMNFDPSEIQISSSVLTPGSLLNTILVSQFDNEAGTLFFNASADFINNLSGTFDVISFEIEAQSALTTSEITFDTVNYPMVTFIGLEDPGINLLGTSDPIIFSKNTPPTITITAPTDGADITRATDVNFTATATDAEDDDATLLIEWSSPSGTFDSDGPSVNGYFLDAESNQITATVTDSNGATSTQTITVNVAEPTLAITSPTEGSLLNSKEVTFELDPNGMDLIADHFHFYINPSDVDNLMPEERINTSDTPNVSSFTYGAADKIQEGLNTVVIYVANGIHFEFESTKQVLTFTVDSTEPEITLLGNNPMELILNSPYAEPGATANDSRDGDVSSEIVIDATALDPNTIGEYEVTYTVTDEAGNRATASRTVNVSPTLSATPLPVVTNNTIIIAPNPVQKTLHLNLPTNNTITELTIYSIDGRVMERIDRISTLKNVAVNVSDYASGTYLLISTTIGERKIAPFVVK